MPHVSLVFDEGPGAGLGHRRRMEALAYAFTGLGYECDLRSGATEAVSQIVVVDSYRCRADDPSRFNGEVVVAIDDLARDLCVDVVVDPSPGAEESRHHNADLVLAGARFALIETAELCEFRDDVHCILVTTGAADVAGNGCEMAGAIAAALPDVTVRLVLGRWGSRAVPPGVEVVEAPSGLAGELAAADLVVCAGGVTLLESMRRGLPTVAVVIADNQAAAVRALSASGAAARADLANVAEIVTGLVHDGDARRELARRAHETIDGQGPRRVATEVARVAVARQRR
ncbi:MAG: pseG [Actinomycetia bacterium]|nr:pseG [Actinomycetes bacterium]